MCDIFKYSIHDELSKGVSILRIKLPYTLQLASTCPITSNSKAA